ncbi:hypothetical protein [Acinetobacter guillouiae]|uniref:hypothetical protein n=1 Tax=Acinetobacter guillouiae TaxID=106649 RepID=UPI0004EF5F53|nr:hypothetical protein [Acinetobacter guillouiae]BAP38066.1 hypothetical protein AS4_31260 [Acinetobacter guillouiae]
MKTHYQINIYREKKLLGTFTPNHLASPNSIQELITTLTAMDSIEVEFVQVTEDMRVLIYQNGQMRTLSSQYSYQHTTADSVFQQNKESSNSV